MRNDVIRAQEGDRLDLLCWTHYGRLDSRVVERVLDANPGLSLLETLPAGTLVVLPVLPFVPREDSLW